MHSYGAIEVSDKELKRNKEKLRKWKKKVQHVIQNVLICK